MEYLNVTTRYLIAGIVSTEPKRGEEVTVQILKGINRIDRNEARITYVTESFTLDVDVEKLSDKTYMFIRETRTYIVQVSSKVDDPSYHLAVGSSRPTRMTLCEFFVAREVTDGYITSGLYEQKFDRLTEFPRIIDNPELNGTVYMCYYTDSITLLVIVE